MNRHLCMSKTSVLSQASLQATEDIILVLTFSRGTWARQHLSEGCAVSQKAAQSATVCASHVFIINVRSSSFCQL